MVLAAEVILLVPDLDPPPDNIPPRGGLPKDKDNEAPDAGAKEANNPNQRGDKGTYAPPPLSNKAKLTAESGNEGWGRPRPSFGNLPLTLGDKETPTDPKDKTVLDLQARVTSRAVSESRKLADRAAMYVMRATRASSNMGTTAATMATAATTAAEESVTAASAAGAAEAAVVAARTCPLRRPARHPRVGRCGPRRRPPRPHPPGCPAQHAPSTQLKAGGL